MYDQNGQFLRTHWRISLEIYGVLPLMWQLWNWWSQVFPKILKVEEWSSGIGKYSNSNMDILTSYLPFPTRTSQFITCLDYYTFWSILFLFGYNKFTPKYHFFLKIFLVSIKVRHTDILHHSDNLKRGEIRSVWTAIPRGCNNALYFLFFSSMNEF